MNVSCLPLTVNCHLNLGSWTCKHCTVLLHSEVWADWQKDVVCLSSTPFKFHLCLFSFSNSVSICGYLHSEDIALLISHYCKGPLGWNLNTGLSWGLLNFLFLLCLTTSSFHPLTCWGENLRLSKENRLEVDSYEGREFTLKIIVGVMLYNFRIFHTTRNVL